MNQRVRVLAIKAFNILFVREVLKKHASMHSIDYINTVGITEI